MIKQFVGIFGLIAVVVLVWLSGSLFETNKFGNYQIKQAAMTGTISVRNEPGFYWQGGGSIVTYPVSEDVNFETENLKVRFNDGSVASVVGTVKFKLPTDPEKQKELHRDYGNYDNVEKNLIVRNVSEALSNTATYMVAEDSYASGRAVFSDLAMQQLKDGIFKTSTKTVEVIDTDGTKFKKKEIRVVYDENGNPVIQKPSLLKHYGIEILQFVVNDFEYDEKIKDLIARKKDAEQNKVVAMANAEKAKQDAITAEEQGKARVAEARANAEVEKITAVVEAQKKAEVAELEAKQAKFEAQKIAEKGKAEAEVARQKVAAGLTPLEKATLEKETAIGVAQQLANVKFPDTMVISGGSDGKANPWDAVGLNQMMEITAKIKNAKMIQ
jgi:regulator of protease activity HflC (stomatin/prohibitin superfamily)|nr:MAG TPA: High frequency of lysogenization C protein [Caudoviricetes sp.]